MRQHGCHFSPTLDFACALRMQSQGLEKNGEGIAQIAKYSFVRSI